MQFISKEKLIKVIKEEKNDLDIDRLTEILNVYGDTYYAEGCRMELCKRGKEISPKENKKTIEEPQAESKDEEEYTATIVLGVNGEILKNSVKW
ncbi:hypothetical protein KYB31_09255 [Clostridium felsineum]|uniref:hypothetical protein n=1 Tax=Clostridium felsineum TaxID=36839 RepID=UPI00214D46CA|nr:hypothetical protein [Clostridium felsineum]MCR3759176.1 hypothetical protein [Clostridium felsineum]